MAASIRPRFALLALFAATPALAQQADPITAIRADRWDGRPTRRRLLCRSGRRQAGHLLPPAHARRRDGGRDQRLHGAEPGLAEPGAAGAPAAGGDRQPTRTSPPPWRSATATSSLCRRPCCIAPKRWRTPAATRRPPTRRAAPGSPASATRPTSCAAGRAPCAPTTTGSASSASPGMTPQPPRGRSRASTRPTAPPPRRGWRCSTTRPTPRRWSPPCPRRCGSDPGMMLDHARWLRHADRTADAFALWQRAGERRAGQCTGQRSSPRSGPNAICWPAACCTTAMPPTPMRSPTGTATSRPSRSWTPSSSPASSRCAG